MRSALITSATVAIALGGPLAPAMAKPAKTTVTIEYLFTPIAFGEIEFFSGTVGSRKAKCEGGRKVNVIRKRAGKDEKVGSAVATANEEGPASWGYNVEDNDEGPDTQPGRYYAVAKAIDGCEEGVSDSKKID